MDASYCPTSRTFYWLRSVLMRELGLDRHDIRPSQALADLIPEDRRREVWRQLRRDGLALPPLRVSWRLRWLNAAHVLHAALEFAAWCNHVLGLVIAFPLGLLAYAATRQQAVHLNRRGPVTVRDAVLYLTNFREHYRALCRVYPGCLGPGERGRTATSDGQRVPEKPTRLPSGFEERLTVGAGSQHYPQIVASFGERPARSMPRPLIAGRIAQDLLGSGPDFASNSSESWILSHHDPGSLAQGTGHPAALADQFVLFAADVRERLAVFLAPLEGVRPFVVHEVLAEIRIERGHKVRLGDLRRLGRHPLVDPLDKFVQFGNGWT